MKYLILLAILFSACESIVDETMPASTAVSVTIQVPQRCEDVPAYQDCITFMDEVSCRLQFCPTMPTRDEAMIDAPGAVVIAPADLEAAARFYLDDLALCRAELEPWLGPGPDVLRRRLIVVDDDGSRSYYGSWNGVGMIVTEAPRAFFDEVAERPHERCADPHETTHAIIADAPIPPLLNEGLAVLAQDPPLECGDDGYVYAGAWYDYEDLSRPASMLNSALTAACLWRWLKDEGVVVSDVIGNLRGCDAACSFLADACGRPDLREEAMVRFGLRD